jgi:hypothetical protein
MSMRTGTAPYRPNSVSRIERVVNLGLALALLVYGSLGLMTGRLNLDGRRVRIGVLEGGPAWLMSAALLVGAAVLLSVVLDHYDKRDNERYYQVFRWCAKALGWCLVASALVAHLYLGFTK